jgi:hypothetical protein
MLPMLQRYNHFVVVTTDRHYSVFRAGHHDRLLAQFESLDDAESFIAKMELARRW